MRRAGAAQQAAGRAEPVPGKSLLVSLAAKALDKVVNPSHGAAPDRLRDAVSGATVLVTGASFGIGEATARKLAAAGATVLLAARSEDSSTSWRGRSTLAAGTRSVIQPT